MSALGESSLTAGRAALVRAAWAEARSCYQAALEDGETVEALEGLGIAARWQMDGPTALAAHERAYGLARESDDARPPPDSQSSSHSTARSFAAPPRRTAGWSGRATCWKGSLRAPEHATLAYWRANRALNGEHDPAEARRHAALGVEAAVAAGSLDLEMICRALEGLALVAAGEVREGMRLLDEATTAARGRRDRDRADGRGHLLPPDRCLPARARSRARRRVVPARRGDLRALRATPRCSRPAGRTTPICSSGAGEWSEAEQTLTAACRDLGGVPRKVADGLVRLAELRRRQGRPDQAEALLAEAEGHRLALLVRAALCLDRGDATALRPRRRSGSCAGSGSATGSSGPRRLELARPRASSRGSATRRPRAPRRSSQRTAADAGRLPCAPRHCSPAAVSRPTA